MARSTASDAQHQDLGAIEAAVKETARGRAFLANYAKRVQQSDTLTMLAMLGRLERMADELAARIVELEAGIAHDPGGSIPSSRHSLSYQAASGAPHATAEPARRLDNLAMMLGNLNHHAVQLAAQCAGVGEHSVPVSSLEIDARAYLPPDPALLSSDSASDQHRTDDEVLNKIAQALAT